jgi:hypothetical protein
MGKPQLFGDMLVFEGKGFSLARKIVKDPILLGLFYSLFHKCFKPGDHNVSGCSWLKSSVEKNSWFQYYFYKTNILLISNPDFIKPSPVLQAIFLTHQR